MTTPPASPEVLTQSVLKELRKSIDGGGRSQRAIEKGLGWSKGYLSQVLMGRIELKMSHVFELLSSLKIDPGEFFAGVLRGKARLAESTEETIRRKIIEGLAEAVREHDDGIESVRAGLKELGGRVAGLEAQLGQRADVTAITKKRK